MTCKDLRINQRLYHIWRGIKQKWVERQGKLSPSYNCPYIKDKSRFVELPCKVGDKVYRPSKCLGVVQFIITSLNIYQSELFFTDDSENIIYLPEIGKTVFLTKEEAVAKLKELNANK